MSRVLRETRHGSSVLSSYFLHLNPRKKFMRQTPVFCPDKTRKEKKKNHKIKLGNKQVFLFVPITE